MFANRKEAALEIARELEVYGKSNALVLGIPYGGVETAFYIAQYLQTDFSVLVVSKLGHPQSPGFAIGAIAEDGTVFLNRFARVELSPQEIDQIANRQKKELERLTRLLRQGAPLPALTGRTVILADDGIASGATMHAAIRMCRKLGAEKIVVAAPVSGAKKKAELQEAADEVVVLQTLTSYLAVSQAYSSFERPSDKFLLSLMNRWQEEKANKERLQVSGKTDQ